MSRSYVFLAHGLLEGSSGIYNLLTGNRIIAPVDPEPAATSGALLGGELWSYSVISMSVGALMAANEPDDSVAKRAIGVAALFYHSSVVVSLIYRSVREWTFIRGESASSQLLMGLFLHGGFAVWFAVWLARGRRCASQEQ